MEKKNENVEEIRIRGFERDALGIKLRGSTKGLFQQCKEWGAMSLNMLPWLPAALFQRHASVFAPVPEL